MRGYAADVFDPDGYCLTRMQSAGKEARGPLTGSRGEIIISRINWPAGFEPANSPIHAANEIEINAAPDLVWTRLVEAPRWPEYYPHASEIHLPAGEDGLRSGIQFTWVTAEKKLVTTVKEYVPNERIAWETVLG